MPTKITVLGSGAMATACSILLAEHPGQNVSLWARNEEHARHIETQRENVRLLPGVRIPDGVEVTSDLKASVANADWLVAAIPSKHLRDALHRVSDHLHNHLHHATPVVSVIKGMENETFMRPSEIICDVLGRRPVVVLGGPSHAEEIARRLPASVVAAGDDVALTQQVQQMFTTDRFRVYTNPDIIGVELAGALKNVIAIAAGISDGLSYGDNAKSALLTRGLVEITRFGTSLGAEPATFSGLAGMGDLITTCNSSFSRNRSVGERLGKGESLSQILDTMQAVAEGVTTTRSIYELSDQKGIEMPITAEVYRVLFEGKSPKEATNALMLRPPKGE